MVVSVSDTAEKSSYVSVGIKAFVRLIDEPDAGCRRRDEVQREVETKESNHMAITAAVL